VVHAQHSYDSALYQLWNHFAEYRPPWQNSAMNCTIRRRVLTRVVGNETPQGG
jgi:hypothetical protein